MSRELLNIGLLYLARAACVVGIGSSAYGQGVQVVATPVSKVAARAARAAFKQEITDAACAIEMVPVPESVEKKIGPFWISTTEVTWEVFDAFIHAATEEARVDEGVVKSGGTEVKPSADAITRPSKPYLPPDRGFGHDGYAAITMSHASATEFCKWLSRKSGRTFRLATEDEWEHACGKLEHAMGEVAWFNENADNKPHAVGTKKPNAFGVYDMLGNVAEWVDGRDGKPVTKGGSYRDSVEMLKPESRQPPIRAWNASDPQIPKSKWWLADGPFVGFRVVCVESPNETKPIKP